MVKKCGKVWVRVVTWDMLPHVLDHKPKKDTEFHSTDHYKRIGWEEFRQFVSEK